MNLSDARRLALEIMEQHRLTEQGWRFRFDRAVMRFGLCDFRRKLIQLSKALTPGREEDEVRNTILHEVAHALVGVQHGHDAAWREMAVRVGARPERCSAIDPEKAPRPRWAATCGSCGKVHRAHRRPRRHYLCASETCRVKMFRDRLVWVSSDQGKVSVVG